MQASEQQEPRPDRIYKVKLDAPNLIVSPPKQITLVIPNKSEPELKAGIQDAYDSMRTTAHNNVRYLAQESGISIQGMINMLRDQYNIKLTRRALYDSKRRGIINLLHIGTYAEIFNISPALLLFVDLRRQE